MNKKIRAVIAIVLFMLTTGVLFTGCGFHYTISTGFGGKHLDREDAKEYKVEKAVTSEIKTISIDTGIADVELIESDNYYVEIDYLYWEEEPEYSLEDGKLYFDDSNALPDSYSIDFNLDNTIKIYLPNAAILEDLLIEDASGDVSIAGFAANDLDVTVSYGDFILQNAAAAKADITLSSGSSKISDFQAGTLEFTNSYGNAKFTNINTADSKLIEDLAYDNVEINMSSGNVVINGLKTDRLDIQNSYGDINCDSANVGDFNMKLSSGDLEVEHSDLQAADISSSYGDVTLNLTGSEKDYSLDLDTNYGNIKVSDKSYDEHLVMDNGSNTKQITARLSSGNVNVAFE